MDVDDDATEEPHPGESHQKLWYINTSASLFQKNNRLVANVRSNSADKDDEATLRGRDEEFKKKK